MLRALTATICSGTLLGCGATWPTRAAALAVPQVHQVMTVDVLPIDLEVWTENGYPIAPEDVRSDASSRLMASAVDTIQERAYAIDGLIDWNGEIDGRGAVMDRGDVERTLASLAGYDLATGQFPLRLPDPHLPARLGAVSGADATLYIGGWAYVAAHHESTGEKLAEGILIGVAVVAVVAIVAIAIAGASKGSHESHGGGGSQGGRGHSGPTFHDHRAVAEARDPQFASVIVHDHRTGEGGGPIVRDHRGSGLAGGGAQVSSAHSVHVDTAIDIVDSVDPQSPENPDWSGDVPSGGEDSQMYVEMTLVDNATGTVVWHAHQKFPASAASPADITRVTRTMLASLPAR